MKHKFFVLLFVFICISVPAFSAEKMRVAIIDLKPKNVSQVVAIGVSNMIRSDFVDAGLFTVVERDQIAEILKEQSLQATGCTDNECAVQMGRLLSAKKILVGDITKMGNAYIITIRIVDVEKGVAEFSSKEKAASEENLDKAASALTAKLIGRMTGKTQSELLAGLETRTMTGYYLRSIVPGWGQFYADKYVEGAVFSGLFAASAAFTTWSYFNYLQKKKAYDDLSIGSPDFKSKYNEYDTAGKIYNYSFIALGGIYLIHWVDVVFFAKPDFGGKSDTASLKEGPYMQLVMDGGTALVPEPYYGLGFGYRF